jgi:hypothetical protein
MGKLLAGIIIGGLGVYAWQRAHQPGFAAPVDEQVTFEEHAPVRTPAKAPDSLPAVEVDNSRFRCDGRTRCPQMKSCEEATFFLEHCPGTKMDGDNDGIPCEDQHCSN